VTFQVDQCKNFKDGKKCEKCGRMMPAYCKDQQDLEDKARKYDEWIASQEIVETETVVVEDVVGEPEATEVEVVEHEETLVVDKEIKPLVPNKARRGRQSK
jgi:hypothetical protein